MHWKTMDNDFRNNSDKNTCRPFTLDGLGDIQIFKSWIELEPWKIEDAIEGDLIK